MEIDLPRDAVGRVIGKSGSVINAIREGSGANIRLDKHDDGSATLSVQGAESMLNEVVSLIKMALAGELDTSSREPAGTDDQQGLPSPPPSAVPRYRLEAEELAVQWSSARRAKDYSTADAIRDRLRRAGFEPEELMEEIAIYGRSEPPAAPRAATAPPEDVAEEAAPDPLGYQPHVARPADWGPTEAAMNHKDGGTGGLLTLNYQVLEPLPPDIGFTVTSGNISATEGPLLALKRIQEEEEAEERRRIAERNATAHQDDLLRRSGKGRR